MAEPDWTLPPLAPEPESLWAALHDGELRSLSSDRSTREVRLRVGLGFPGPSEPCPDEVELVLGGVTHALVYVHRRSPEPPPVVVTPITDAMREADAAYRAKSRAETIALATFAQALGEGVEIMSAELSRAEAGLTLDLQGYGGDDDVGGWWALRIGAASLDVLTGGGDSLGLDELLRLGRTGWDEWAADAEARRSAATVAPDGDRHEQAGEQQP